MLFCALAFNFLKAQDELQVVTKTITKNIPYKSGDTVFVDGKKAEIIVNTWERDEVKIQVKLSSKHPLQIRAEKDMEMANVVTEKIGNSIYIKNDFGPEEQKPESNLSARYQILMPTYCPLTLKNHFGQTDIEALKSDIEVAGEFSKIRLNNVKGNVNITSYFGDIEAQYLTGDVTINSRRSNIDMSNLAGDFEIKAQYGLVKIDANQTLINLDIEAEKSDVHFTPYLGMNKEMYYNLLAEYGKISVPKDLKFDFLENSSKSQKAIYGTYKDGYAINITTSFGKIIIGQ